MKQTSYEAARISIEATFREEGSVPEGTVRAHTDEIIVRLEIESGDDPEAVRELVRIAENGCWVLQSLQNPVNVVTSSILNGQPIS